MLSHVYVHLVWTTRDREPILDADTARFLCRLLRPMARREKSEILALGIVRTHIHLLVRLHSTIAIAQLVKRLKGASSAVAKTDGRSVSGRRLYWAKGYSAHSVGLTQLEAVEAYLKQQPRHHPLEAITGWDGDLSERKASEECDAEE